MSIEARTRQESKTVFARLHHHRLAIEQALGYSLTWQEKPNSIRSTIYANYPDQADLHHDASSAAALNWVVTQISRLQAAITPPANHGE